MVRCQILHTKDDKGNLANCLGLDPAVFDDRWMTPAELETLIVAHTTGHTDVCVEHNLDFYKVLGFPSRPKMMPPPEPPKGLARSHKRHQGSPRRMKSSSI
jgi:hypothetical protein